MTLHSLSPSREQSSSATRQWPNEYRRHGSQRKDIAQFLSSLTAVFALLWVAAHLLQQWPHRPLAAWLPLLLVSGVGYLQHTPRGRLRVVSYLRLCSLLLSVALVQVALALALLWALHVIGVFPSLGSSWRYAMLTPYVVAGIAFCRISPSLLRSDPRRFVLNLLYDRPSVALCYLYSQLLHWPLNSLFTPITPQLLLGSLPFAADVRSLSQAGVTGVVNMCDEYEGPVEQYHTYGIAQCRCPTVDMTPPTVQDLERAVRFIQQQLSAVTPGAASGQRGPRVFVHCKTGMSRSAAAVLCYLVASSHLSAKEAIHLMKAARPDVSTSVSDYTPVQHYIRSLRGAGHNEESTKQMHGKRSSWRHLVTKIFQL